ncbi:hypothetical protein ABK040_006450 [Willaertia magna]
MVFNARLKILINLERFVNSGMLYRGYYFIKVTLKPRKTKDFEYEINSCIQETCVEGRFGKFDETIHSDSSSIRTSFDYSISNLKQNLDKHSQCSKVFLIKYHSQEIVLREAITFDIVSSFSKLLKHNLIDVSFHLYHKKKEKHKDESTDDLHLEDFKLVSKREISLRKAIRGFNLYYPVIFDNWFFSVVKTSIHSSLVEVSYSKKTIKPPKIIERRYSLNIIESFKASHNSKYEEYLKETILELFPTLFKNSKSWTKTDITTYSTILIREFLHCLLHCKLSTSEMTSALDDDDIEVLYIEKPSNENIIEEDAYSPLSLKENRLPFKHASVVPKLFVTPPIDYSLNNTGNIFPLLHSSRAIKRIPTENINEIDKIIDAILINIQNTIDIDTIPRIIMDELSPITVTLQDQWLSYQRNIITKPKETVDLLFGFLFERMSILWDPNTSNRQKLKRNGFRLSIDNLIDKNIFFAPKFSQFRFSCEISLSLLNNTNRPRSEPATPSKSDEIFVSVTSPCLESNSDKRGNHLVIFIPGYRSNHYNFICFKTIAAAHFNDSHDFYIVRNLDTLQKSKEYSSISIREMAELITNEIYTYIFESEVFYTKISFICHSLGGIILRAALYYYEDVWQKYFSYFNTLICMSVPHLGIGNRVSSKSSTGSNIVKAGLWFLKSLKGEQCLREIYIEDKKSIENKDFSIYDLATSNTLSNFNNIILVASEQDTYVPIESALIQRPKSFAIIKEEDPLNEMAEKLNETLSKVTLIRCVCDMSNLYAKERSKVEPTEEVIVLDLDESPFECNNDISDSDSDEEKEKAYSQLKRKDGKDKVKNKFKSNSFIDKMTGKAYHTSYLGHQGLINAIIMSFRSYLS